MSPLAELLRRPRPFRPTAWFSRIAQRLLNESRWVVAGRPCRLTEIEFYYVGNGHADPFAHANPVQAMPLRWYFHRTGGSYRGGSFKGLDLTFGDGHARGGILFRGLETSDGSIIDGPSLLVDFVLRECGFGSVADLDRDVTDASAEDTSAPMFLTPAPAEDRPLLSCARVGLGLRRATEATTHAKYLMRPYRFVADPHRVRKGKPPMIVALHRQGIAVADIVRQTGSPMRTVAACVKAYEAGQKGGAFDPYYGHDLAPRDRCTLQGIADRLGLS